LQLAIGDWIHNKLQWRWQIVVGMWWGLRKWWNGCWNVVGTCEMMKWLLVCIGHWGRCCFRLCVEHQNLKLHYHMKLRVPTTKV
jgi:hypothetical protein